MFQIQMPSSSPLLSGLTSGLQAGAQMAKLPSTIRYLNAMSGTMGQNTPLAKINQLYAAYSTAKNPVLRAIYGDALNKLNAVSRGTQVVLGNGQSVTTGGSTASPSVTLTANGPVLAGQVDNSQDPNAAMTNPYSVSRYSNKGAQYAQGNPQDPNQVVTQSAPTNSAQTIAQVRSQAHAELPIIGNVVTKGIAPYNSLLGGPKLAWDSFQSSPLGSMLGVSPQAQQAAHDRLANYVGAKALATDEGSLQARLAGNPNPGQRITDENVHNLMGNALHPFWSRFINQSANNAAIPIQLDTVSKASNAANTINSANYPITMNKSDLAYTGGNPYQLAEVSNSVYRSAPPANPHHQAVLNELAYRQAMENTNGS